MNFDLLTEDLPKSVRIHGKEYPIQCDFRIGIKLDGILRSELEDQEKIKRMLVLYFKDNIPPDIPAAIDKIIWFYRCGELLDNEDEEKKKRRYIRRKSKDPACVLTQDAPYVYAAFMDQYGIDLTSVTFMHWWKFMALFESLGDETKMSKIMYYRQASTSGMSKERRAFINEMKKIYKIKGTKKMTLQQRNQRWKDYVKERFENRG
ncbi:bacteriophage Gp15 family protein [uncultured Merdimonas sp.]|uniref:bacteriophage Gp15 family protein n=1 Tax=uncultured Merdimonas sp. TaxID=2023269 RepID=UPI0032088FC4